MKRILTLLTVCLMASVAMAQNAGIMVSVNKGEGGLKFFRSNQLMEAIEAAEINDTIYLSAGNFDFDQLPQVTDNYWGPKGWTKPLVIIGAGSHNKISDADPNGTSASISDRLYIKFDESVPLAQRNISFEGIHFCSSAFPVCPASEINELRFKNFRGKFDDSNNLISQEEGQEKEHTYINNVIIDECQMVEINLDERNVHNITVLNSNVQYVNGSCSESSGKVFTLNHCRIDNLRDNFMGLVEYSVINSDNSGAYTQINSSGINNTMEYSLRDKCVPISDFEWESTDEVTTRDGSSIILDDGSKMGTYPSFSLYPSYPTIDVNKSESDYYKGVITITVKLLGENDKAANE